MTTRKSPIKARDGRGRATRAQSTAVQDARAIELRCQNMSYPAIARAMGIAISTAYESVARGLAAIPAEAVDQLRRVELESLGELEQAARAVLTARHVRVDHGKVIEIDGEALLDDAPVLHAIAAILKIKERRARLMGLDAPTKVRIEVVPEDVVDAEIARLEGYLAGVEHRDRGATGEAATTSGTPGATGGAPAL